MTPDEMKGLHALLSGWMRLAHARARKRSGLAFCEAADIQETWQAAREAPWRQGEKGDQ